MSANTANAIKALIESLGLGVSVYRDRAPNIAVVPYVTVIEAISVTADSRFNSFDDPEHHVVELAQIDVWQPWRDASGNNVIEDYPLVDAIIVGLDGARLPDAPNHVAGTRLAGMVRDLEHAKNIVHHAITVEVRRVLVRA